MVYTQELYGKTMSAGDIQERALSLWDKVNRKSFKDTQFEPCIRFNLGQEERGELFIK